MSVFSRLGYNFDSTKFGDAGKLTSNTQSLLSLTSNNSTFYDWQAVDLGAGSFNRQSYYQNPTASVISQLSANLSSLISIATTLGTPTAPGVYTAITNTAAALAATATSCTIELGRFLSHTSNISGYSSNTSTALVPTYDSMLAVGNQLVMILNKTDGIANTVGLMGAMTSLFISDQLSANNTLINSDYVTINTAGVSTTLTQLNTASAHVSGLNTLLLTRRNADWTFYQNAQQVVKDYSNLTRFSRLSDTQTYMINNMIGTPTLISNITKTTTTPVSYSASQLTPYASPSGAGAGVGLTQTGVNPGSYIAPLMTIDSYGRTTSIANTTISVDSSGTNTTISGNANIAGNLLTNNLTISGFIPTPQYGGANTAVRALTVGGGEISIIGQTGATPVAFLNIHDYAGNLGNTSSLIIRGLSSNGSASANLSSFSVQALNSYFSGNISLTNIDNSVASTDVAIGVGQSVQFIVSAKTSIPLRIACGTNQIYEISLGGNFTAAAAGTQFCLQPNNTAYGSVWTVRQIYASGASAAAGGTASVADPGFRIGIGGGGVFSATAKYFTTTAAKRAITNSGETTSATNYCATIEGEWQDTTTVWTSLGTILSPVAWTGIIIVRRLM